MGLQIRASIGELTTATIQGNTIKNSAIGIAVKDGSQVHFADNKFSEIKMIYRST